MLGSHDGEEREGTIREWKTASYLAMPSPSQAFLSIVTLLQEGSYCMK